MPDDLKRQYINIISFMLVLITLGVLSVIFLGENNPIEKEVEKILEEEIT